MTHMETISDPILCFQHTACILHFLPSPNLSQLLSCLGHCDGPYLISLLPLWSHDLLSTHQPIMNVLSMTFPPPTPHGSHYAQKQSQVFLPCPQPVPSHDHLAFRNSDIFVLPSANYIHLRSSSSRHRSVLSFSFFWSSSHESPWGLPG